MAALLLLMLLPLSALATNGYGELPADINAAINAEGSEIVFETDELNRWSLVQTDTEQYAVFNSPEKKQ